MLLVLPAVVAQKGPARLDVGGNRLRRQPVILAR